MTFCRGFKFKRKSNLGRVKYTNTEIEKWGIQAFTSGVLLERHRELIKQCLIRELKGASCDVRINYNITSVKTKKPLDSRMGGGKSNIESYGCVVVPGFIIMEIKGISFETADSIFKALRNKLSCKIRLVRINEQKDRNYIKRIWE